MKEHQKKQQKKRYTDPYLLIEDINKEVYDVSLHIHTVKPVDKGHPKEKQNMVFINKWSLFRGYFVVFYQVRVIEVWPLFT